MLQMVHPAGQASARLARKLEAACIPLLACAQEAAGRYGTLAKQRDLRGAAQLASKHLSEAAAWLAAAVGPAAAALRVAVESWAAAAAGTPAGQAAGRWLREGTARGQRALDGASSHAVSAWAICDPVCRLPLPLKRLSSSLRPASYTCVLLALGSASIVGGMLLLAFGT